MQRYDKNAMCEAILPKKCVTISFFKSWRPVLSLGLTSQNAGFIGKYAFSGRKNKISSRDAGRRLV